MKEYNIKQHYNINHNTYDNIIKKARKELETF